MADNLPEHMYPTWDDNGGIKAPPYASQVENFYNHVNRVLLMVDDDHAKPLAPPKKQYAIPQVSADAEYRGGSVDEYATLVFVNSTKIAYIDPSATGLTYSLERSTTFDHMYTHIPRDCRRLEPSTRRGIYVPNKGKTTFLPRQILTSSVL
jgi:hypothetical protein